MKICPSEEEGDAIGKPCPAGKAGDERQARNPERGRSAVARAHENELGFARIAGRAREEALARKDHHRVIS
jgi:hypothetical protein